MHLRRTVMGVLGLLGIVARLSVAAAIHGGISYTPDAAGVLSNTPGNHGNDAGDILEDYMEMLINVEPLSVDNGLVNRHNYTYVINHGGVCSGDVFLLALIKTSPESFSARQNVRRTWGSVTTHGGVNIKHVFIMGSMKRHENRDTIDKHLLAESNEYGDIVQGDFTEHFRNQTLKAVMALTWAKRFCNQAKFILNANDQTMVDPYHLVDFLSTSAFTNNFLYCSTFLNQGPKRSPMDKLFVTLLEYPYQKYPPHCEEFANVMSNDVMSRLLDAAIDVPFFWIDDVYVTGFLALRADVRHTDLLDGHTYSLMQKEHIDTDIHNNIFLVAGYDELLKNWDLAWQTIVKQNKDSVS